MVPHSVTKFINGHADVVGGILVAKEASVYKLLRSVMINSGCDMDPHQAFLVLRGLKTLNTYDHVDMEAFRAPLDDAADQLLRDVTRSAESQEGAVA